MNTLSCLVLKVETGFSLDNGIYLKLSSHICKLQFMHEIVKPFKFNGRDIYLLLLKPL